MPILHVSLCESGTQRDQRFPVRMMRGRGRALGLETHGRSSSARPHHPHLHRATFSLLLSPSLSLLTPSHIQPVQRAASRLRQSFTALPLDRPTATPTFGCCASHSDCQLAPGQSRGVRLGTPCTLFPALTAALTW